jgi:predicted GNAT family acetyltransferase
LVKYREKIKEIENKNYYIPKHLLKFKKGWRRVVEKRRRRHLLRAYELFAKRRDKMIAFADYSRKKLEVNMLKRGHIWKKRNMRLLAGINIEDL